VHHGKTGFVIPPTDVDTAIHTLRQLLGDASLRTELGAAGRQAAVTYFNWDRVARETLDFTIDVARAEKAGRRPSGVWERGNWLSAWPR
jgi:glycosyltransferase involved in cell wall biosynthesis